MDCVAPTAAASYLNNDRARSLSSSWDAQSKHSPKCSHFYSSSSILCAPLKIAYNLFFFTILKTT